MKDKRLLIIGGLVTVLLIAIPLTVYIANQQQDVRSSAQVPPASTSLSIPSNTPTPTVTNAPTSTSTPTPSPTVAAGTPTTIPSGTVTPTAAGGACQTPTAVTGVEFAYPSCQGTQCNFTEASCTWAAVNGAVSYTVKITQVESGTVTRTTTVTAPTVTTTFPVEQGKTYRCDIAAVNSCGTSGEVGSAEALCTVDGQVSAPTVAPTTPAGPTAQQVIPTVVPTGDFDTTIIAGIGGVVVTIVGGLLFFFSGI